MPSLSPYVFHCRNPLFFLALSICTSCHTSLFFLPPYLSLLCFRVHRTSFFCRKSFVCHVVGRCKRYTSQSDLIADRCYSFGPPSIFTFSSVDQQNHTVTRVENILVDGASVLRKPAPSRRPWPPCLRFPRSPSCRANLFDKVDPSIRLDRGSGSLGDASRRDSTGLLTCLNFHRPPFFAATLLNFLSQLVVFVAVTLCIS